MKKILLTITVIVISIIITFSTDIIVILSKGLGTYGSNHVYPEEFSIGVKGSYEANMRRVINAFILCVYVFIRNQSVFKNLTFISLFHVLFWQVIFKFKHPESIINSINTDVKYFIEYSMDYYLGIFISYLYCIVVCKFFIGSYNKWDKKNRKLQF